jgi:pimeloyl-ACP methyl ester carboxylesterase
MPRTVVAVSAQKRSVKRVRARGTAQSDLTLPMSLRPPGLWKLLLEGRVFAELWASVLSLPVLRRAPKGDGHPVLIFPGLAAGDISTLFLRTYLRRMGYEAYGWEQGLNLGPKHGVLAACKARVEEIFQLHGSKLSLIGWSLGGLYAREMAKICPGMVRQVITMGSPFAGHPHATNAWRLFEFVSGHRANDPHMMARLREAPSVPTSSIYSKSDGIVSWQCSVQASGKQTENIEVPASHFGLGVNPLVLYVLADRLAQQGKWKPFSRRGLRGALFPKPQFA